MKIETPFGVIDEQDINSVRIDKLIAYLVLNRRSVVSVDVLSAIIWPQGVENPYGSLRGLVFRAKKILQPIFPDKSFITASKGSYEINRDFDVSADTEFLSVKTNAVTAAKAAGGHYTAADDDLNFLDSRCSAFMESLSSDIWGLPVGTYYNSKMLSYLGSVLDSLYEQGRFDDVILYAAKGLAIDPLSEGLHEKIIKSLLSQGNRKMASDYYRNTIKAFMQEYNISPSNNFKSLQKIITNF
ncbi:MAG: hypothetical protein LUH40_00500 [Clostridiales bacterium]|nr:hypothetical protein [Clostridiales bacterium]